MCFGRASDGGLVTVFLYVYFLTHMILRLNPRSVGCYIGSPSLKRNGTRVQYSSPRFPVIFRYRCLTLGYKSPGYPRWHALRARNDV